MTTDKKKKFSLFLKFKLHSEQGTVPEIAVQLNGVTLALDTDVATGAAELGANNISIVFSGKRPHYTNMAVEIEKFLIDNYDLTHNLKADSTYITDSDTKENTYGYMHQNGTLTFEFVCPVFYFLRNKALIKNQDLAGLPA